MDRTWVTLEEFKTIVPEYEEGLPFLYTDCNISLSVITKLYGINWHKGKRVLDKHNLYEKVAKGESRFSKGLAEPRFNWDIIAQDIKYSDDTIPNIAIKYHMEHEQLKRLMYKMGVNRETGAASLSYKKAMREKYGVDNPTQSKDITKGIRERSMARTGHTWPIQSVREKIDTEGNIIQRQIENYIHSFGVNYHTNDRLILDGLEADIVVPDAKLLIEVNLTVTHTPDLPEDHYFFSGKRESTTYHRNKTNIASEKGYSLIHVFGYEWADERTRGLIKSRIKTRINGISNRIYGRKTEVKEVPLKQTTEFLNTYHLQGSGGENPTVTLGLYYDNELYMSMTFGRARYNMNVDYELLRMATKSDTIVVGGASKLFSYFIKNNLKRNEQVLSYSDRSKGLGLTESVYSHMGFEYIGQTDTPNYIWVHLQNELDVRSRYQTQKKQLVKQGYPDHLSEIDIMKSRGYGRVFDSGQDKWLYSKE